MSSRRNNFLDVPSVASTVPSYRRPAAKTCADEEPDDVSEPCFEQPSSMHRRSARPTTPAVSTYESSGKPSGPVMGFQASASSPRGPATGTAQASSPGMGMPAMSRQAAPRAMAGAGAVDTVGRRLGGMAIADDREPDAGSEFIGRPKAAQQKPSPSQAAAAAVPRTGASWSPPPVAPRGQQAVAPRGVVPRAAPTSSKMLVEDVDNFDADFDDDIDGGVGNMSLNASTRLRQSGGKAVQGEAVPQQTMRAIQQLLWGTHGQPPPSWHQGFFFSTKPGLHFGLVQMQGGPCGVLAAVQAHVLAALTSPNGAVNISPRPADQQAALVTAISKLLWQARSGPNASLALLPSHDVGSKLTHEQLMRGACFVSASNTGALQEALRSALPTYMEQGGWGIVLLLVSLLLTRSVHVVRSDMDEPSNALMGMHGYCTQEMVNLILVGQAVSNVFDGEKRLDGSVLKGVAQPSRLGFLTLFEWYKYVEVGKYYKRPELPIWVICSESHFTVLFAADAGALRGAPPFELYYYDELANQEDIIRLTIRKDPAGGWTARVGDSFGDRGKCEGHNIPPLECVIETRWPGVSVDWNGTEPML